MTVTATRRTVLGRFGPPLVWGVTLIIVAALAAASLGWQRARAADDDPTTLVMVLEEDPPYVNPALGTVISNYHAGGAIYGGLVKVDVDFNVSPDLAERWEISDDKRTYTFHLRPNVKWHDGEPFTSADVKWSVENFNSQLQPYGRSTFKYIESIETPDELTVIFNLTQPFSPFLVSMEMMTAAIAPQHVFDTGEDLATHPANKAPVGTGPYKLQEWAAGDHITLVRNEDYYGERPQFDTVVFRIMPDAPSRLSAYDSGEVDAIYLFAFPISEALRYAEREDTDVTWTGQRGGAFEATFNTKEGHVASDVQVRRAIVHAIDRQFMRENVNVGSAVEPYQVGPVSPLHRLYNSNLEDYEFNPDLAEQILDDAGYPRAADGTRFEIAVYTVTGNVGLMAMSEIIQQNLSVIGVEVNLFQLDRAALNETAYVADRFDIVLDSHGLGPDPAIGTQRFYDSRNIQTPPVPFTNNAGYSNPEVDALFDQSDAALSDEERKRIYDQIQELIWADVPVLPLMAYNGPNVYRTTVVTGLWESNGKVVPNGLVPNWEGAVAVGASPSPVADQTLLVAGAVVIIIAVGLGAFVVIRRRRPA